jgi:deoxyadenosine/deoxycytidine kinase
MHVVHFSGNTGCGKSTLLKATADHLSAQGMQALVIDEKELHHPLLRRMFEAPAKWALPIQLNFITQRTARLLEAAESRTRLVLMERSLAEDALFFGYYAGRGVFSPHLVASYEELRRELEGLVPGTREYVYLTASRGSILARLDDDCRSGKRESELQGDALRRYVGQLNELYKGWEQVSWGNCRSVTKLVTDDPGYSITAVARELASRLATVSVRDGRK